MRREMDQHSMRGGRFVSGGMRTSTRWVTGGLCVVGGGPAPDAWREVYVRREVDQHLMRRRRFVLGVESGMLERDA